MTYTHNEIAGFIAREVQPMISRFNVAIGRATFNDQWGRYEIVIDYPGDYHELSSLSWMVIDAPVAPDPDKPLDADAITQSWVNFKRSIAPFVAEIAYRVERWFDLRDLKATVQQLTPDQVSALRRLKDDGFYDAEWLGLPMTRKTWDDFAARNHPDIAPLAALCDLGLAQLLDGTGYVTVVFDGRGADALDLLDGGD